MAEDIRRRMAQSYLRPTVPDRPAALHMNDSELVAIRRRVEHSNRASVIDKKIAGLAGKWCATVERLEYEGGARLRQLLWAIELLLRVESAGRGSVQDSIAEISDFVHRNYGVKAPPMPKQYPHRCGDLCVQFEICSYFVRYGEERASKDRWNEEKKIPTDPDAMSLAFGGDISDVDPLEFGGEEIEDK